MKFWLIVLTVLVFSCAKVENDFEKLTQAEKDYLISLGLIKCREESADDFQTFINESNEQFATFSRGQYWKFELKQSDVLDAYRIFVWKTIPGGVIFLVEHNPPASTTSFSFLKYTSATNTEMIIDLQTQRCTKAEGRTATHNSSGMSYTLTTESSLSSTQKTRTKTVYSIPFNQVALFANFNNFTRTIETLTINNESTSTPTRNQTGKLGVMTTDADGDGVEDLPFTAIGDIPAGTKYCVVKENVGDTYTFPFVFSELDAAVCTTSKTAGPTTWADPSLEL